MGQVCSHLYCAEMVKHQMNVNYMELESVIVKSHQVSHLFLSWLQHWTEWQLAAYRTALDRMLRKGRNRKTEPNSAPPAWLQAMCGGDGPYSFYRLPVLCVLLTTLITTHPLQEKHLWLKTGTYIFKNCIPTNGVIKREHELLLWGREGRRKWRQNLVGGEEWDQWS